MGDVADMMLEGMLCEGCGEFLGEGMGFPQYCASCAGEAEESEPRVDPRRKLRCPWCKRQPKGERGLIDHCRDAHGVIMNLEDDT